MKPEPHPITLRAFAVYFLALGAAAALGALIAWVQL